MREKCAKILSHDISCFINRQLIYNFPEEIFADAGVMAIGEWVGLSPLMPLPLLPSVDGTRLPPSCRSCQPPLSLVVYCYTFLTLPPPPSPHPLSTPPCRAC